MRIGVDVGGTNTDAVLMEGSRVLAAAKSATTADVVGGIVASVTSVLADAKVEKTDVQSVMIGTTHFTNALIERRRLSRVGVIRIGYPATTSIPPLFGWPKALREQLGNHAVIVGGGYEYDGRLIAPLDEMAIANAARDFRSKAISSIAISSVFAPLNRDMEDRAQEIVLNEVPGADVSLSADFGRLGLLERENATAINASLVALAKHVIGAFREALRSLQILAPFFISQNDGTLMTADYAVRHPALTFAAGLTNSIRGAALLANLTNAVVVDVGGTTSDIGALQNGFPRESAMTTDIGGVRTNFRMPDLISLGIGGGSIVDVNAGATVGPRSVGFEISSQALVFGGDTLTATDLAVAGGLIDLGDRERVKHLDRKLVEAGLANIKSRVETAIDSIKLSADPVPVVLVGGGSILLPDHMAGASSVVRPRNYEVANAVGAAIAQAGGEVDRCYAYDDIGREAALDEARSLAIESAVAAGARRDTITITDIEEVALAYVPGRTTRLRVRAVGDMTFAPAPTGSGAGS